MKKTVQDFRLMKGKDKIAMLTCYDYSFARAMAEDVDVLLVGDSLGNVVLGYDSTRHVTMGDMIRHVEAVRRGAPETFIVADLAYKSYNNENDSIKTAKELIKAGANAVKPEGRPEIIRVLVKNGIHVVGHIGLLPQSAKKMGVVGRAKEESEKILQTAMDIEKAGAFMVVIESVPAGLAEKITKKLKVPTIGIGAGKKCDGQVLVLYDLLGLYPNFEPKFARKYLNLKDEVRKAVAAYSKEVKAGEFPSEKESFK